MYLRKYCESVVACMVLITAQIAAILIYYHHSWIALKMYIRFAYIITAIQWIVNEICKKQRLVAIYCNCLIGMK
jgi:hypothetical protein